MRSFSLTLSHSELDTAISALMKAAARHESEGRAIKFGSHHDIEAKKMRELRSKLGKVRADLDASVEVAS